MKRWSTLLRERYRVISDMGVDSLKDIVKRKESGLNYWDAVKSHYLEWIPTYKKKDLIKYRKKIRKIEWKP